MMMSKNSEIKSDILLSERENGAGSKEEVNNFAVWQQFVTETQRIVTTVLSK